MAANFISPNPDNLKTPSELMSESLDNAGVELDNLIANCLEDLESFKQELTQTFKANLEKVKDKLKVYFNNATDDLANSNIDLVGELKRFEVEQIKLLVQSHDEIRQKLNSKIEEISNNITLLTENNLADVMDIDEQPLLDFEENKNQYLKYLNDSYNSNKRKIDENKLQIEEALSSKSIELQNSVESIVLQSREDIENQMANVNELFESKINEVVQQLTLTVSSIVENCANLTQNGMKLIDNSVNDQKLELNQEIDTWFNLISGYKDKLSESLEYEGNLLNNKHNKLLAEKNNLYQRELNQLFEKAKTKISAVKSEFKNNKRKLESDYLDRLDRLASKLETVLSSETSMHSDSHIEPLNVLKENLKARINAHGSEMIKDFQRQINQLESEYARLTANCHEKIDYTRQSALDGLDKQLRLMKAETERTLKTFHSEIVDLKNQLPQIEEAGQAAAMVVKAYRNSRISFDLD